MKKVLILIMAFIAFGALNVNAQTTKTPEAKHRYFGYVGTNWTPHNVLSYSGEVGIWGTSSNTSYSIVCDAVPNGNKNKLDIWFGPKFYFTTHSEEKLCYMIYVSPKVSTSANQQCIEYGIDPYYSINKPSVWQVTTADIAVLGMKPQPAQDKADPGNDILEPARAEPEGCRRLQEEPRLKPGNVTRDRCRMGIQNPCRGPEGGCKVAPAVGTKILPG